jgi:CRP-like cAMP-binding protein
MIQRNSSGTTSLHHAAGRSFPTEAVLESCGNPSSRRWGRPKLNPSDQHETLRITEIFETLSGEALDVIADQVMWRRFEKGVEVVSYKDTSREVYFIARGRVRVTNFSASGREISYQDLVAGSMFGELSAIDGKPRTATVITLEPSQIGSMSCANFWAVLEAHSEVTARVLVRLTTMVRLLTDRVYLLAALDVKDRVRAEVVQLARKYSKDGKSAVIEPMPTHVEIANRIITHREAVTRELNELSRLGLIKQEKRVLTVCDIDALADLLPEDL